MSRTGSGAGNRGRRVSMLVWNTFENDARVLKEAETLVAAGWQVTVHALHTPGETRRREVVSNGVKVVRVLRSPGLWFRRRALLQGKTGHVAAIPGSPPERGVFGQLMLVASRTLTHLALLVRLVQSRPAVVHAHDVNVAVTAWIAAQLCFARFVYDAHEISTSREGYRAVRPLVARIERWLMPRARATITTTGLRARFFARAYQIQRPMVLQNWPRYQPWQPGRRLHEELGLAADRPIVLYQGGLQQGRGLEQLVRAAAKVGNASFVFVGGGRLAGPLQALVGELAIGDRVKFVPTVHVTELPSYTVSADIGVQPLENTCFNHFSTDSNKLFEYLMAGLPVVATSLPEMKRVIRRHRVGRLVEPGSVDALAEAVGWLVDHPGEREAMRERALAAAREYCWEAQEHRLVELYDGLSWR